LIQNLKFMKTTIAFFLLTVVYFPGFSQLKKVEKSFRKGQYEKCIEQAKKTARSRKNLEELNYYQCKSYFSLFNIHKNNLSYLDKSISFYPSVVKSKSFQDKNFSEAMKLELERISDSLYQIKNQNKSRQYVKVLAVSFKDTMDLYTYFYPKKEISNKKTDAPLVGVKSKNKVVNIPSRDDIIKYAEIFQSIPYKWGGEDSAGFDCSGLVLKVMRKYGYNFNHGAKDQSELGFDVSRQDLKPGDLVFFGKKYSNGRCKIDHVAIAHTVSKDTLIVIHSTSKGVNIQELKENDYWGKKILFYRNIIDQVIKEN
jgi:cell wall-associated NlpC family hydrolase